MDAEAADINTVHWRIHERDFVGAGEVGAQLAQDLHKGLPLGLAGTGSLHLRKGLGSDDDFSARCLHRLGRSLVARLLMARRRGSPGLAMRRMLAMRNTRRRTELGRRFRSRRECLVQGYALAALNLLKPLLDCAYDVRSH